jgi:hypothetical protein
MSILTLPIASHHITANPHSLEALERHIPGHQNNIETWFRQRFQEFPAHFLNRADMCNGNKQISIGDFSPSAGILNNIDCCMQNLRNKSSI